MNVFEQARRKLFWLVDGARGSSVQHHLREIKELLEQPLSPGTIEKKNGYLTALLTHASASTRFYASYDKKEIVDFPVIDKNIIRDNFSDFQSARYAGKKLRKVSTSGSTGTPFFVVHDDNKRRRQIAENLYINERSGFRLGERLYYLRIWNAINRLSYRERVMKNIVPVEASHFTIESVQSFINRLAKDQSNKALLAYSSTYEQLAYYLERLPSAQEMPRLSVIFAMSEALPSRVRSLLRETFQCPVLLRYSNSENGFLGFQYDSISEAYLANTAGYFFEVLELNSNRPVQAGQPGRIVITDLFNFAMPFIRYDTGDVGVMNYNEEGALLFERIDGRRLDVIYNTAGEMVSPHVIDYSIRREPGVKQFQCIQTHHGTYVIRINCDAPETFSRENVFQELKKYLGPDAIITVDFVDEIPLLKSGKRKIVVNQMTS
jgi:phenylacetate-CoA ligase